MRPVLALAISVVVFGGLAALVAGGGVAVEEGGPATTTTAGPDGQVLPLPVVGGVEPHLLDDGTPVFVARGHDGEVFVVETVGPGSRGGGELWVGWCPWTTMYEEARTASMFDRAGHHRGGPAEVGLTPRDARVGDAVVVGRRLAAPGRDAEPVTTVPGWHGWACASNPGLHDPTLVTHHQDAEDSSEIWHRSWEDAALADAVRRRGSQDGLRAERVVLLGIGERVRVDSDGRCFQYGGLYVRTKGWQANHQGSC